MPPPPLPDTPGQAQATREPTAPHPRPASTPAGKQASQQAGQLLARGVSLALAEHGFSTLTEFSTPEGRRMDVCALGPKGELWCVEVKSSRADFAADSKWHDYLPFCDRLFFAVPASFPLDLLPGDQGLMVADRWGAEILRMAPEAPVAPARRKALTLRFARLAAERLARGETGIAGRRAAGPASPPWP